MALSLVILAAGKGTRFGGNKPLAVVGPAGQSLFEYSVHDAARAGIKHIVFVVSENQDTAQLSGKLARFGETLDVEFVTQRLSTGIDSEHFDLAGCARTKPWGTAHAVLACQPSISNPFMVINADDYYGQSNFQTIGHYLNEKVSDPSAGALAGYRLKNTLSRSGGVNRGICSVGSDGFLQTVHEMKNICADGVNAPYVELNGKPQIMDADSIVSMTFWGFHPGIFQVFNEAFQNFLQNSPDLINDEFYIPDVVDTAIKSGRTRAKVFSTSDTWKGLTYAADQDEVREYIAELTEAGAYP